MLPKKDKISGEQQFFEGKNKPCCCQGVTFMGWTDWLVKYPLHWFISEQITAPGSSQASHYCFASTESNFAGCCIWSFYVSSLNTACKNCHGPGSGEGVIKEQREWVSGGEWSPCGWAQMWLRRRAAVSPSGRLTAGVATFSCSVFHTHSRGGRHWVTESQHFILHLLR